MPRRALDQPRPLAMTPHYLIHPEGSVLVAFGDTKVICTATVDERVPPWLSGKGKGWVTAEYDMLPRSTNSRKDRDARKGKVNGRTQEISRLVGRALRSVVDLAALGERSITIDCDVLQADGGTRTAAITGGYVALALAVKGIAEKREAAKKALTQQVAAISVGIVDGQPTLDLDYSLDVRAEVDMNVVMTGDGRLGEVQGTGESATFSREQLNDMLDLAFGALPSLLDLQRRAIEVPLGPEPTVVTA